MRKWPKDNTQTVEFSGLAEPITEALKQFLKGAKVEYRGYDIGDTEKVGACSPDETLTTESLSEGAGGVDGLNMIIEKAIQLGMEQGRRGLLKKMKNNKSRNLGSKTAEEIKNGLQKIASPDSFPSQGNRLGRTAYVYFTSNPSNPVKGEVVRHDDTNSFMIIKLDDGRYILDEECAFVLPG